MILKKDQDILMMDQYVLKSNQDAWKVDKEALVKVNDALVNDKDALVKDLGKALRLTLISTDFPGSVQFRLDVNISL